MEPPPRPAAAPGLPQRQSCDRCYKQKLRCTRENNGNGGVCDRCLRKRSQCVYSFSLPKGRPSLYRQADESTTSGTSSTENRPPSPATEPIKPPAVCEPVTSSDVETDASAKPNVDTIHVANSRTSEHSVLAEVIDTSIGMPTGTWPLLETLNWNDMQLEVDWSSHDSSYVDDVLSSLNTLRGGGGAREFPDLPSPTQLPCPQSPRHPHTYFQDQPGGSTFEKHDGSNRSNMDTNVGPGEGGDTVNISQDKYVNYPNLVISQLSQLSMRLSSLRYSSYTLAKATESPSCHLPNGQQIPLIDAASFESVAAWLAHGHDSANLNAQPSIQAPAESQGPYPSPGPEAKPRGGHGILHDVFSASHHLLEILHFHVNSVVEPSNSSTTTLASPPSTATSSQSSLYFGLTKGPEFSALSSGSQQRINHTMQIIRHLVIACEALLLEIYMAILIALQHDAYPGASMSTTALGDVRLVLVVQLCSYLIDRQHQAVDLCLAPQSPFGQLSVNEPYSHRLDFSTLHQSVPPGHISGMDDREVLSDLKNQVQQRLMHLRQTLQCT